MTDGGPHCSWQNNAHQVACAYIIHHSWPITNDFLDYLLVRSWKIHVTAYQPICIAIQPLYASSSCQQIQKRHICRLEDEPRALLSGVPLNCTRVGFQSIGAPGRALTSAASSASQHGHLEVIGFGITDQVVDISLECRHINNRTDTVLYGANVSGCFSRVQKVCFFQHFSYPCTGNNRKDYMRDEPTPAPTWKQLFGSVPNGMVARLLSVSLEIWVLKWLYLVKTQCRTSKTKLRINKQQKMIRKLHALEGSCPCPLAF